MKKRDDGALSLQLSMEEALKRHCYSTYERNVARSLDCLWALSSAVAEARTTEGKAASSGPSSPHLGRSGQPIPQVPHLIMPVFLALFTS